MTVMFYRDEPVEQFLVDYSATGWLGILRLAEFGGWDPDEVVRDNTSGYHPVMCLASSCAHSFADALENVIPDLAPQKCPQKPIPKPDSTVEGNKVTFAEGAFESFLDQLMKPANLLQGFGGQQQHIQDIAEFAKRGPSRAENWSVIL